MLRDEIQQYLPKIRSRELTNRSVARLLNASETHICRLLKQLKVKRDPAPARARDAAHRALIAARQELRTELANDPDISLAEAARRAGCSVRTIYRYRST